MEEAAQEAESIVARAAALAVVLGMWRDDRGRVNRTLPAVFFGETLRSATRTSKVTAPSIKNVFLPAFAQ